MGQRVKREHLSVGQCVERGRNLPAEQSADSPSSRGQAGCVQVAAHGGRLSPDTTGQYCWYHCHLLALPFCVCRE